MRNASLLCALIGLCIARADDRVVLRDGLNFAGKLELGDHEISVTQRDRIIYIAKHLLLKPEEGVSEPLPVTFRVPQPKPEGPAKGIVPLSGYTKVDPFDEFGRRAVTIADANGRTADHIQVIYSMYPTHVETDLLKGSFKSTVPLSAIDGPTLRKILKRCIDPKKEVDRIKVIDFLIQAGRFLEANQEIEEFGEAGFKNASQKLLTRWKHDLSAVLLERLRRWLDVGQWTRADALEVEIRKLADSEQLAKLDRWRDERNAARTNLAKLRRILVSARDSISSDEKFAHRGQEIKAACRAIELELTTGSASRLAPMAALANQPKSTPSSTLSLAISGWCAGPDLALEDLEQALIWWRAREMLRRGLTADEVTFQEELRRLHMPVAPGKAPLDPRLIAGMIPLLAAPNLGIAADRPTEIKIKGSGNTNVIYQLYLPPEYSPARVYPLLVSLHDTGGAPDRELAAWRTLAADQGWIVACPDWRIDKTKAYAYSAEEHRLLNDVLVDLRTRFAVDSDRVILGGHGRGADVAWDFAASHPDQFAGLLSFNGLPTKYSERYLANLEHLPSYSVHGGLNMIRAAMMKKAFDTQAGKKCDSIYVLYPARGAEGFGAEREAAFDWMTRRKRNQFPSKLGAVSARTSDRDFFWLRIDQHKDSALTPPLLWGRQRYSPATLSGTITDAGMIQVRATNIESLSLALAPKLTPLDNPSLTIKVNGKTVEKGPLATDLETLLREVRHTGDRSRLIHCIVTVPRL